MADQRRLAALLPCPFLFPPPARGATGARVTSKGDLVAPYSPVLLKGLLGAGLPGPKVGRWAAPSSA